MATANEISGRPANRGMPKRPIAAIAAAAALAAISADMAEANYIRPLSEAEAMREADLAVAAVVIETGVPVVPVRHVRSSERENAIYVDGFRLPCIRARVVERMKGRSPPTIVLCTRLEAETSELPPLGRRVSMFLRPSHEVWLEVVGAGFRERPARRRRFARSSRRAS